MGEPTTETEVRDADWYGEDLSGREHTAVRFSGVDLTEATGEGAVFTDCTFVDCKFNAARFTDAAFLNCSFTGCAFFQAEFTACKFVGSRFQRCTFDLMSVDGGDWSFVLLPGADLARATLAGTRMREADLTELVRLHRSSGAKATILLTPVADPSRYGLVRLAADGRVESFLEKPRPEEIDTDLINAGLYVLEPEALADVPDGRAVSIEPAW